MIYKGKLVYEGPKNSFVKGSNDYRLVVRFRGPPPEWMSGGQQLGPDTWSIEGESDALLALIPRFQESSAEIVSFHRSAATLEASFFDLLSLT